MRPARHFEFETLVIDVANAVVVVIAVVNLCAYVAVYVDAIYVVADVVVVTMVHVIKSCHF
jgi:hypothetical protein